MLQFSSWASWARCSHFFHLAPVITRKLPPLFLDMIESRLIDSLPPPRLEISQRCAARIDTGRSNKAVAYEATTGLHTLLHQQLPPARPPSTHTHPRSIPSNLSVRASRLARFINDNSNKRDNEQRQHNHSRNVMLSALIKTPGHCLE